MLPGNSSQEDVDHGDLNVQLFDQRMEFEWVQKHISKARLSFTTAIDSFNFPLESSFGGNPTSVTGRGDSARAAIVDLHLSAYE